MKTNEILIEIEQLPVAEKLLLIELALKSIRENVPNTQLKEAVEVYEKRDFWDELSSFQKTEIMEGIEQLDRGERVSYESILKKINR
jgi:predicted transcriptional regulator